MLAQPNLAYVPNLIYPILIRNMLMFYSLRWAEMTILHVVVYFTLIAMWQSAGHASHTSRVQFPLGV